jgi:1,4-alpha-glucan branching enzyme
MMLTADYPPASWSGIAAAVEIQAEALANVGVEAHVVVGHPTGIGAAWSSSIGVRVHGLSAERFPISAAGFDWVHLHSLALAELALEIRKRFRVRLAYTAHSVISRELSEGPARDFWSRVQLAVMRASDVVIFLSESERAAALGIAPELEGRSRVVANGIRTQPVPPLRTSPEGPIVFAGRFAQSKGIGLLAELVTMLAGDAELRFVLAGGHGDTQSVGLVRRLAARLGSACQLAGWLAPARLRDLFARASLVVAPSEYEPFGMVALEAMSMGAPVLAARTGGLAEIVRAESGGRLVESRDPGEWRDRASAILTDATEWRGLHERGPRYVARLFDARIVAERLMGAVYAC